MLTEPAPAEHPTDGDRSGPRRALVAVYGTFALAATARAAVQLSTQFDRAPLAYLLSAFSGLVYITATVGLVTRRRWSRPLAWVSCGVELAGVLIVGVLSIVDAAAFPRDTVWSRFGSGYLLIPLILPIVGLYYLHRTRRPAGDRTAPVGG